MNPYLATELIICAISCSCLWFGTGWIYKFGRCGIWITTALALLVIFHAPY